MLKLTPAKLNPGYDAAVRRMLAASRRRPAANIGATKPTKPHTPRKS